MLGNVERFLADGSGIFVTSQNNCLPLFQKNPPRATILEQLARTTIWMGMFVVVVSSKLLLVPIVIFILY